MNKVIYYDFMTRQRISKEEYEELYNRDYTVADMIDHMLEATKYHKAGFTIIFRDDTTGELRAIEEHRSIGTIKMKEAFLAYLEESNEIT